MKRDATPLVELVETIRSRRVRLGAHAAGHLDKLDERWPTRASRGNP